MGALSAYRNPVAAARTSAWVVWLAACGVYFLAVLHRMSLGVAGPVAIERLDLSAAQLGTFVMLQLGVYAAMQVPWGIAIDRWGPRRVLLVATALIGVGQVTFAFAASYPLALAARALLGLGDSAVYIAVLRLVVWWFPRTRYALMAMLSGLFGMIGNLAATVPLALAFSELGWVRTFAITGGLSLVYALLLLRPAESAPYRPTGSGSDALRSRLTAADVVGQVRRAWAVPEQRLGFWTHQATMASGTAFTALWAFPYLTAGLGYDDAGAASMLTLFVVGLLVSSLVLGPVTGRRPAWRGALALGTAVAGLIAWLLLLGWPAGAPPLPVVVVSFLLLAVGGPASQIGFQIARDYSDPHRIATATGIVNVGGFAAAMLGVVAVGVVLDVRAGTAPTLEDYRVALAVLAVGAAFSTLQMLRWLLRCRRRLFRVHEESARPFIPVAHWWDRGYERAALRRPRVRRSPPSEPPSGPRH